MGTEPSLDRPSPNPGSSPGADVSETFQGDLTPSGAVEEPATRAPGDAGTVVEERPTDLEGFVSSLKALDVDRLNGILSTVESAIVKRPLTVLAAAVFLGYAIGRALRR